MENHRPFYPDVFPADVRHPTTANFIVVETGDDRGRGLKVRTAFRKGDFVAKLTGTVGTQTTLNTIQISPTLYFSDAWFCRFLLHSCAPNMAINVERLEAIAIRDISPADYLTIDYANCDDTVTLQFACGCGAANCRGWITGRAEAINDEGRTYLAGRGLAAPR